MPTVKYDVSGEDHERAAEGGGNPPKPGWYNCRVKQCLPSHAKGDDGKPDKSRPRLEVIYEVKNKKYKGAQIFDYITFGEASKWKLDQFLQAVGIKTSKKEKGSFDTDDIVGTDVKVRVKGDTYNGEYRAKVGRVAADDTETEEDEDEADDEEVEDAEDEEDEDAEAEDEEDEEEEEPEPVKKKGKAKAKPAPKKAAPKKKGKKASDDEDDDLPF